MMYVDSSLQIVRAFMLPCLYVLGDGSSSDKLVNSVVALEVS